MIIQHHNQDHNNHSGDDNFDAFLSKHLQQTQAYLPDDDFTARVMQQLPAPKKLSLWQERLIIAIPLLIISLLVLSQFSVLAVIIKLWMLLVTTSLTNILQVGILTAVAVISGVAFWFAKQVRVL